MGAFSDHCSFHLSSLFPQKETLFSTLSIKPCHYSYPCGLTATTVRWRGVHSFSKGFPNPTSWIAACISRVMYSCKQACKCTEGCNRPPKATWAKTCEC